MVFSRQTLTERQQRLARAWAPVLRTDEVVAIFCGEPIGKPGGFDQTYDFLPHPLYFWLSGRRRKIGVTCFDVTHGFSEFVLPFSRDERVWEGDGDSPEDGADVATLSSFLGRFATVHYLGSPHGEFVGRNRPSERLFEIRTLADRVRRRKDEAEIALVRRAAACARHGYEALRAHLREGVAERTLQIEYEAASLRAGADGFPYGTLVGAGSHSAILHAEPSRRRLGPGEHVLIDAGAHIADYCVDITRVYTADGSWNSQQQQIVSIVEKAQRASLAQCLPGQPWWRVHEASARAIAEGLHDLNILLLPPEEALSTGAIGVFFPHGVGHLVGLRVRDVGCEENRNPKKYFGAFLRVDLDLEEGHMLTVEPGCYFIPALIDDPQIRTTHKQHLNWSELDKWRGFGGVRIEDDIVIRSKGPEILTGDIPRQ